MGEVHVVLEILVIGYLFMQSLKKAIMFLYNLVITMEKLRIQHAIPIRIHPIEIILFDT